MHTTTKLRLKLFLGCLFILVVSQAFNGALSLTSLEKLYTRSLVSSFEAVGNDFLLKLQAAVRYGKPLDKFFGIEKALDKAHNDLPELSNVIIALPEGRVVQSQLQEHLDKNLAELLRATLPPGDADDTASHVIQTEKQRHLLFVLQSPEGGAGGYVVFTFPELLIRERVMDVLQQNLAVLGLVTAAAALLLLLGLWFFVGFKGGVQKKRLYAILLICVGGAQLAYSFYNITLFHDRYVEMTSLKTEKLTRLVRKDVEFLLDKGLSIDRLVKIEDRFMDIITKTPEVAYIEILNSQGTTLNLATKQGPVPSEQAPQHPLAGLPQEESFYDIVLPLYQSTDMGLVHKAGLLHVGLDRQIIRAKVREIFLDSLTVTLISLLFVVELLIFFTLSLRRSLAGEDIARKTDPKVALERGRKGVGQGMAPNAADPDAADPDAADPNVAAPDLPERPDRPPRLDCPPPTGQPAAKECADAYMLGRPAAFAFLFMWALPTSFIPLYMKTMYEPMLGLSKDVVLGLPISVEMLCAMIAALISGAVSDRKGWHLPFITGAVFCAGGALLAASAMDGRAFILARAVTGLGYGLSWMAIQSFIFQYSAPDTRARGIANLVAGIVSGQICGTAVGAMLAERLGYAPVFIGSALLAVLPVAFVLLFMRPYLHKPVDIVQRERVRLADVVSLVFNRNYFAILFFSLVPFALCQVGLLLYAAPIYLNEMGVNQSNIGRVLMIYGLSVIYVAPWISRFVDRSSNKKMFIVLGGVIGAAGLMSLYFYSGFLAVMLAVFLMGLSGSLVGSSQSAFALKLAVIQRVGVGKAMSVQRAADKLGQMLGPLVVGAFIASVGIGNGIAIVGVVFFVATLVFLLVASEEKASRH